MEGVLVSTDVPVHWVRQASDATNLTVTILVSKESVLSQIIVPVIKIGMGRCVPKLYVSQTVVMMANVWPLVIAAAQLVGKEIIVKILSATKHANMENAKVPISAHVINSTKVIGVKCLCAKVHARTEAIVQLQEKVLVP